MSERVIQEIARTTQIDPFELPPLYEAIDPDALNMVIETMSNGTVSFTYAKHEVTVSDDGSIDIEPVSDSST